MAISIDSFDNMDKVLKDLGKLNKKVDTEIIRGVRQRMYATMRSLKPIAKKASPENTGALVKSVKVRSRSKGGLTRVWIMWGVPYAGIVNFRKSGLNSEGFATDLYNNQKAKLEKDGREDIVAGFIKVMRANGIKVKTNEL
jgi:hypothetical protein